jgi:myo-inositol-1(or 4)-monophosphatase
LQDEIVVGIVLNPITGELFTAVKGRGAELNGKPIRVSDAEYVSESLLVTGFPYNLKEIIDELGKRFLSCLKAGRGIRRFGSAALDLCFVACGRFDGFWEQNLHQWDVAAGLLIVKEAGGCVTDFSDNPFTLDKKEILATNGKIHEEMLDLLTIEE